ncbi:MAG TPA: helix-turn-helix domain-containing protein [Propionibacteriaceae bacterium]|nr:helix-turn-helix domain-containing protein [Propionibacteriaceae bacterium]
MSADAFAGQPRRGYASATRTQQARRTRTQVIDAATRLFVERGYATTTMRAIATDARVSLPTVELLFGTKAQLLHVVLDVAIAGDDEPVPMLSRAWADGARLTTDVTEFLSAVAHVLRDAQIRSAGVMLAAYEAAVTDPDIDLLVADREMQRERTAGWIVDGVMERAPLRPELDRATAIDAVWMLMDPVVFIRLTRHRGWSPDRYATWFADSVAQQLVAYLPAADG